MELTIKIKIRDDLCDFNDDYIVVAGKITVTNPGNDASDCNIRVSLKNFAPFFNLTLKINYQLIEDAQDLDIVISMFNLLYSKTFRRTTGSFWSYYPDIPNSLYTYVANTPADELLIKRRFRPIYESESFDYKTKFINALPGINDDANNDVTTESEEIKIVVPLKNLSNFVFSLDFVMINTEIELILNWSPNRVLTQQVTRPHSDQVLNQDGTVRFDQVDEINRPKDLKFNITDCKLYVPVVTLQEKYENELLKNLKTGISFYCEWGRYRTQIINQPATNN